MSTPSRRTFLQTAGVTAAAMLAGAGRAEAIAPFSRKHGPHMKLSLAAYSVNWLITPMRHPDASAFEHSVVMVQALLSLGIALFLLLRRRPRPSSPPAV